MARIRGTTMDPNYRGGDSNEMPPEGRAPDEAAREPSGDTLATPSDSILGSYNEETSPAQEAEQPGTVNEGPNSPSGSDDGRIESSSSSYLTMSEDSEEAERPSWQKEAKNMLPTAKKASDICKENLEKKLVAQAAKKDGGVIPRSLQKQIQQRPSVEEPAHKALLRMEGLKKAYIRKQEEADQVKSLQNALKESKTKIDNLQAALDNAEDELKKHEEPLKRLEQAEKNSKRLQLEKDRLVKEAADAQRNFQATLEADQSRLIEENEQDCKNRMKRAFSIIHPGTDYNVWELAYK
ncbi:uncharacterized protein LOC110696424 [Chenopodium quinoa]|uniref:uncharacterized protein LOC110696424 n=1 Tax=Chenopodium quinoa TaxID=63459 RepID=UPI000B77BF1A|nr:uncharacterized protein LOC110696424 [Chenopodium quinoa]